MVMKPLHWRNMWLYINPLDVTVGQPLVLWKPRGRLHGTRNFPNNRWEWSSTFPRYFSFIYIVVLCKIPPYIKVNKWWHMVAQCNYSQLTKSEKCSDILNLQLKWNCSGVCGWSRPGKRLQQDKNSQKSQFSSLLLLANQKLTTGRSWPTGRSLVTSDVRGVLFK